MSIIIQLEYDWAHRDGHATLKIPVGVGIEDALLSIAHREYRNGTDKYQKRHTGGPRNTRDRPPELSRLNYPIGTHYEDVKRLAGPDRVAQKCVVPFTIGDLTANLLRPHYDSARDTPLFHLDGEMLGTVPFTLLICYLASGGMIPELCTPLPIRQPWLWRWPLARTRVIETPVR